MKTSHKNTPLSRIYTHSALSQQEVLLLGDADFHYLIHVMRKQLHDEVIVFNGRDGEWLASIDSITKRSLGLCIKRQLRPQQVEVETDIWLLFAPPRGGRLDTIIEKTTELGVSRLVPVLMRRSVVDKINLDKCQLHAKEAAEQCERLSIPEIAPIIGLEDVLTHWDPQRLLLVCDETGGGETIHSVLQYLKHKPLAFLIGPEGGFSPEELQTLSILPFVKRITMGPRILRVDTACIAALVCWQASIGDWNLKPHFKA
ncbi:MAG: 16S rRNA (uracil(1498)-N(3))-methyltransferase [Alphaproteobacteria bacterium]|nr:16S rRNA (uracil(1498)-N(3))-methyltransferase [Alphaproteobacteria bacterium]